MVHLWDWLKVKITNTFVSLWFNLNVVHVISLQMRHQVMCSNPELKILFFPNVSYVTWPLMITQPAHGHITWQGYAMVCQMSSLQSLICTTTLTESWVYHQITAHYTRQLCKNEKSAEDLSCNDDCWWPTFCQRSPPGIRH
jgi:hypothetical protein